VTETGIGINVDAIGKQLIKAALSGLNQTIKETEQAAKKHAPVRKIFAHQGQGRRRSSAGPDAPIGFGQGAAGKAGYDRWRRARPKNRQINIPANDARLPSGPLYGHNNSFIPVMRYTDLPGTITMAGNMRRYDKTGRQLTPRAEVMHQVNKGPVTLKTVNPNDYLNSRGRWEARSGRAAYSQPLVTRLVVNRETGKITRITARDSMGRPMTEDFATLGGRLRGEIFAVPAQQRGPFFWGYVISPVDYSVHQEFGTRYHRAQPFLRPALYESRRKLRSNIERAVMGLNRAAARTGSGLKVEGF